MTLPEDWSRVDDPHDPYGVPGMDDPELNQPAVEDDLPTAAEKGEGGGRAPQLFYPTLDAFVAKLLAPTYRRVVDGRHRTWCPQWWRHAEAIARLEAMWRSWEHLRQDPATGVSVWFRDHADPHMAVLLDPDGPFKHCSPEKGHLPRAEPLPLVDPPPGLFSPPTH